MSINTPRSIEFVIDFYCININWFEFTNFNSLKNSNKQMHVEYYHFSFWLRVPHVILFCLFVCIIRINKGKTFRKFVKAFHRNYMNSETWIQRRTETPVHCFGENPNSYAVTRHHKHNNLNVGQNWQRTFRDVGKKEFSL